MLLGNLTPSLNHGMVCVCLCVFHREMCSMICRGLRRTFLLLFGLPLTMPIKVPFCTIDPTETRAFLEDERFDWLVAQHKPKSEVKARQGQMDQERRLWTAIPSQAYVTVVDIAGLISGAHKGALCRFMHFGWLLGKNGAAAGIHILKNAFHFLCFNECKIEFSQRYACRIATNKKRVATGSLNKRLGAQ